MVADLSKPDGYKSLCLACARRKARAYREDPAVRAREAEAIRDRHARNRARTREQIAADRDRCHPDGLKHCPACWTLKPFSGFYAAAHQLDGLSAYCRTCQNRKAAALSPSSQLREAAAPHWAAFGEGHRCIYCHGPFEDVDHVVPRSAGGTDDPENLVPACADCNRGPGGKFAKPLLVWAAEREASGRPLRQSALLARVFEQLAP